jgi:regulator of ribonuclease activity A
MGFFKTTDLCDRFASEVQIAEPIFRDFGGSRVFHGPIVTLKVYEDNALVRAALEEPGAGRLLVVDGGGSMRCALLGEQLAELALNNGWAGLVINGCIRDSAAIATLAIGVRALAAYPAKSAKRGIGERDILVRFAGIYFLSGEYVYLDEDGLVVSKRPLL